jgi:O-Antigen ligase
MRRRNSTVVILLLFIFACCLFEFSLHRYINFVRKYEIFCLSLQWPLLSCLLVWCGIFIFLTRRAQDWLLIGFLLFATALCLFAKNPGPDVLLLVFTTTLGRAIKFFQTNGNERNCLLGLIGLLALSAWWHLDMSDNYYHGRRWMGLWDNPNAYGMLMASGVNLATGQLASKRTEGGKRKTEKIFLWLAIFMMGIGLAMSYSRGAWLATAIGLFYLAWCYGKLIWRYVLPVIALVVVSVLFLWSRTPDSAPWFIKRADLGRPSAQHRVSAWLAGLEIMRDHPFGVGRNNAVSIYVKSYSPPEGGAPALTTNDYLMIGTELGIPALLCFVIYAALCLRGKPKIETESGRIRVACRAGAIVFLVAFWFDGGLFKLPTAALFWVLLELGKSDLVHFTANSSSKSTISFI